MIIIHQSESIEAISGKCSNVGKKLFDAFSRAYDSWNAPEKKYWYVDEDSMCVYIVWGEKYE